jgi:hypothetical protein
MIARICAVFAVFSCASLAQGAEVTRVVSALDDENRFDFNVTLSWLHESKSAFVKRESVESGVLEVVKDLQYAQTRDVLDVRMDFGILWDVGLHVAAPLVLADDRTLSFDWSASNCTFAGPTGVGDPTCVNQYNSKFLRDGIVPGYESTTWPGPGNRVFKGPTRSGFESLNVGLTWAAFNQLRDDTRPTWTLGFEAKLDVFKDMRFDSANPGANTAVGLGYHQFIWSTYISKRFRHFDPYFGAWYMLPVRANDSIYQDYPGGNQTAVNPQMRAGLVGGFEQIAWENPRASQRVTVEFRGRMEQHFFGRSASELWEPLTGSSTCAAALSEAGGCRPVIDQLTTGGFAPHPGVTETQEYASFGGDAGLNVQVGKYVRFRGLFGLLLDMPHFITSAGAGVDRDGNKRVSSDLKSEANVTYRDGLDTPGRRFKVEGTQVWSLFLQGSIMF